MEARCSCIHCDPLGGITFLGSTDYKDKTIEQKKESEEWSSQLIFQFKQLERRSLKKSGLQRDSNPVEALIFSGFFFPIA